jgi:hypothetical protein
VNGAVAAAGPGVLAADAPRQTKPDGAIDVVTLHCQLVEALGRFAHALGGERWCVRDRLRRTRRLMRR